MRIVSLHPASTSLIRKLGLERSIVGADTESVHALERKDIISLSFDPQECAEGLRGIAPDLIFSLMPAQAALTASLRDEGFTVIHEEPKVLSDVSGMIRSLGVILQCEDRARELERGMREALNAIQKRSRLFPRRMRVYIEEASPVGHPMVAGLWVPELLRIAGGESWPLKPGEPGMTVTGEEFAGFAPDLVILSHGIQGRTPREVLENRGWPLPGEGRSNALRSIDPAFLFQPGPDLIEGAQRIYSWLFELQY